MNNWETAEGFNKIKRDDGRLWTKQFYDVLTKGKGKDIVFCSNPLPSFSTLFRSMIKQHKIGGKFPTLILLSALIPRWFKRRVFLRCKSRCFLNKTARDTYGLNTDEVIEAQLDIPQKKKKIVAYFGHASASKGVVDAAKMMKNFVNVERRMYVTNPHKKLTAEVMKIDARIKMFGFQKDVRSQMMQCDIILLPYHHEAAVIAHPLTMLEALNLGKVVYTNNDLPFVEELTRKL